MANMINIEDQINESIKDLPNHNYMLGRSLAQPFKAANSCSRGLMYSIHYEQSMPLLHAETPIIQTGYQNEFGRNSTSFVTAESDYTILHKINKFEGKNDHYYLITYDKINNMYDVIERISYNYNTESYGYLWDNSRLDCLSPGNEIKKGSCIKTSKGFDEYGNKMDGVNLVTAYIATSHNTEDSIEMSRSAAKKLASPLVKNNQITLNDNDIFLNLYGDDKVYKTFPDIGEEVKNGMFCSIRRIENDNILYTLSQQNLKDIMLSDRNILMDGIVADINVYCNNPEALGDSHYNSQLMYYYNQSLRFCKEINDIVGPLAMNSKLSYNLQKLYSRCRDVVAGKQFFKEKLFSHVIMEVTVIETLPMKPGDKLCDRYGGKGVVSKIIDDELMPVLETGRRVDIIKNQSTCINRENIGQLHEQSLSFIGMRLVDHFKLGYMQYTEMAKLWYKFVSMVDIEQANMIKECINLEDEFECRNIINSIIEDDGIILSMQPYTTIINIDTIAKIYEEFDFIKQYKVKVPMQDSNGNIRMVNSLRPMVVSKIYHFRLKQYAEEKFSVTSLSATNLKNLNTRSKANKMYEAKYTKTPIMFGFMESTDLMHMGVEYVVMNLMLYSSSPQGRRLIEQLLVGDPYNIDIKLDQHSKNRNAEIINALMETMGLKLIFKRIPKKPKHMVLNVMTKVIPPRLHKPKTNIRDIMGRFDELPMMYNAALTDRKAKRMVGRVMCKKVGDEDGKARENVINVGEGKS